MKKTSSVPGSGTAALADETWQVQDAKARFSELFRRARTEGPQLVSRHGKEAVVVLRAEEFERLTRRSRKPSLARFLAGSPLAKAGLRIEREDDYGRPVEL